MGKLNKFRVLIHVKYLSVISKVYIVGSFWLRQY